MITKRSREGELLIDHRASPGMPAGFMGIPCPEGSVREFATMTCAHCNAVVVLNAGRTRDRGHCHKCDAYICDSPACHANCTPFAQILDNAEKLAYRAQQNALTFLPTKGL